MPVTGPKSRAGPVNAQRALAMQACRIVFWVVGVNVVAGSLGQGSAADDPGATFFALLFWCLLLADSPTLGCVPPGLPLPFPLSCALALFSPAESPLWYWMVRKNREGNVAACTWISS